MYYSAKYPEFYFDPQDVENPLKYQYASFINQLSPNVIKKDRLYFKKVELEDNQDIVLNDFTYKDQLAIGLLDKDSSFKFDNDYLDLSLSSELYTNTVYYDKNGVKFIRTYMKLQDLLANIGGFMQLIVTFGKIITSQFNSYQRNTTLINHIFDFSEEEEPLQYAKSVSKKQSTMNLNSVKNHDSNFFINTI
jgi:hypothetical protein